MANTTDVLENRFITYLTVGTTPAALTAPMRIRLLSALGAGDAPGTVVTVATVPAPNLGATVTGDTSTTGAVLRWEGLANPTTVAGYQILDSAATPVITMDNIPRTGGSVSVTGGIFEIAAGALTAVAS